MKNALSEKFVIDMSKLFTHVIDLENTVFLYKNKRYSAKIKKINNKLFLVLEEVKE